MDEAGARTHMMNLKVPKEIVVLENKIQKVKGQKESAIVEQKFEDAANLRDNEQKFENLCQNNNLKLISPLWQINPVSYMHALLDNGFEFIMTSVSSDGLDQSWLGKKIGYTELQKLEGLSKKFQFNLNFEGGEAETFVINCPLFKNRIKIINSTKTWDGIRGRFEIVDTKLENNA